ncbi:MAG: hypothetical protein FJ358_05560 [Thaumarchaeota archaeon]|nr:hypothetical protein [Nitrososphaerota archaeon]
MAAPIPFATSEKRMKLPVFTLDECLNCKMKNKRAFKMGDYVFAAGNPCQSCKGNTMIVAIFAEKPANR